MKIKTHSDIINKWPSVEALSIAIGVKYPTIHAWRSRDSIPSRHWQDVIKAGKKIGVKLTPKILLDTSQ